MNFTNKKLLVVFALIFLLATILGGWFVFRDKKTPEGNQNKPVAGENTTQKPEDAKPSSVDTSDWKTYRNEELGFEMKYPDNIFDFKSENFDSDNGFRLFILEKGHSIDDINSTIVFAFNQLKSEKFYDEKKNGKCIKVFSFVEGKDGIICSNEKLANIEKNNYDLFLNNASCNGFFEIWFDEKERPLGDVFSYVKFGCTKDPSLERVYKEIFDSIVFFSPRSSN